EGSASLALNVWVSCILAAVTFKGRHGGVSPDTTAPSVVGPPSWLLPPVPVPEPPLPELPPAPPPDPIAVEPLLPCVALLDALAGLPPAPLPLVVAVVTDTEVVV